jgi:hypothetical protein
MNILPVIVCIVCLLLSQFSHGQTNNFFSTLNVYGNPNFIQDSLDRIDQPIGGLKFYNTGWEVGSLSSLIGGSKISLLDSNAYSSVDFRLGSAGTQSIVIDLYRPLGPKSLVGFNFQRISHPGWVAGSFTRSSKLNSFSKHCIGKNLEISTKIDYVSLNRDQFGGYLDSSLTTVSLADESGRIELGTDAGNVLNKGEVCVNLDYKLYHKSDFTLVLGSQMRSGVQGYRYSDLAIDSEYSNRFSNDIVTEQHDSFLLKSIMVKPYLEAQVTRDSTKIQVLRAKLGIEENWYWLRNNNRNSKPTAQNLFFEGEIRSRNTRIQLATKYYLSELNYGNYEFGISGNHWFISEVDPLGNNDQLRLDASLKTMETNPGYMFSNFRSELLSIRNSFKNLLFSDYFLGLAATKNFLSFGVRLGYTKLVNYIYFDQSAVASQYQGSIELYSVSADVGLRFDRFSMKTEGKYQMNNRARIYSLPEWINNSMVNTNWPLFKDRLKLNVGLRSKFYSGYYARGYHPFLNSFYVQRSRKFADYIQLDALAYVTIKSVDIGLDILNASYGIFTTDIMVAPNYVSIPRFFQLHINWRFKN